MIGPISCWRYVSEALPKRWRLRFHLLFINDIWQISRATLCNTVGRLESNERQRCHDALVKPRNIFAFHSKLHCEQRCKEALHFCAESWTWLCEQGQICWGNAAKRRNISSVLYVPCTCTLVLHFRKIELYMWLPTNDCADVATSAENVVEQGMTWRNSPAARPAVDVAKHKSEKCPQRLAASTAGNIYDEMATDSSKASTVVSG